MTAQEQYAAALRVIDEQRALLAAGTAGPWESWSGASAGGGEYITAIGHGYTFGISPGYSNEEGFEIARQDAALIVAAVNAFGPMLDAMEAVLRRHAPHAWVSGAAFCDPCSEDSDTEVWPCADARAVLDALGVSDR